MRLAVLTDTHQAPPGVSVQGIDTAERLGRCVAAVNTLAPDADATVVMGDLVEHFLPEAYAVLVEGLRPLAMPVRLMMGNHDERAMLRAVWPALDDDGAGFAQAAIRHADGVVLLLDTSEAGTHEGAYCEARQSWLRRQLDAAGEAPVLVCMHHPPMALGTWSDRSRQRDHAALGDILAGSGQVRHILAGHTHRACSGTWRGIGYTVLHGIGPQNVLRWGSDARPDAQDGPAHVAVVDFVGGDVRVHVTDVTGHHRSWPRPAA
jgi:3',5'-cyclic AMP phosphodiesterase CpdA